MAALAVLVAQHKEAQDLIGNGIMRVTVERIEGTVDPNRRGKERTDIVLYRADGSYARIHPGRTLKNDAKVMYFNTDIAQTDAAQQWSSMMAGTDGAAEHIFTTADAAAMPNTDRLTHKEFWRIMEEKCPVLHGETTKPIDITA